MGRLLIFIYWYRCLMSEISLRGNQSIGIDKVAENFRKKVMWQILYAPTGTGKTEMAFYKMLLASKNGNKCAMLMDRRVLVNQTSARLDKYGIEHGVLMAGHAKNNPDALIQIVSEQTLASRGGLDGVKLWILDEAHSSKKSTIDLIKKSGGYVVGLSASPFIDGLADIYQGVVSFVTTNELVEQKLLAPLKVFVAKEVDMTGAKKIYGEWSEGEAEQRAMKITGDVVKEWQKRTIEFFGKPVKTIVFSAGVKHGQALAAEFQAKGFNFVSISYLDKESEKEKILAEFSKSNSSIMGLIATDVLTKGADFPDVLAGVSVRPFSKSFSSHVQQMGRAMRSYPDKSFALWICIAKGSKVLTNKGLVAIDKVSKEHKIWDGTNFVSHNGAICNGYQKTITYQGLTATKNHLVRTKDGWRTFGECATKQIRIVQTGIGRSPVRLGKNYRANYFLAWAKEQANNSRYVRMFRMWLSSYYQSSQLRKWKNKGLQRLQQPTSCISFMAIQQGSINESKVYKQKRQQLSQLWRKGYFIQIQWCKGWNCLDNGESWYSRIFKYRGKVANKFRQDKSLWSLRAGESEMDNTKSKSMQQERESKCGKDAQVQTRLSRYSLFRRYVKKIFLEWNDRFRGNRKVSQALDETEREVWDILDCGPTNSFTCEGLLVHNCHSGNFLRFYDDWVDLYYNGVDSLKPKNPPKEKTKEEKEEKTCPECQSVLFFPFQSCDNCDWERPKNEIEFVQGETVEVQISVDNAPTRLENGVKRHKVRSCVLKSHTSKAGKEGFKAVLNDKFIKYYFLKSQEYELERLEYEMPIEFDVVPNTKTPKFPNIELIFKVKGHDKN